VKLVTWRRFTAAYSDGGLLERRGWSVVLTGMFITINLPPDVEAALASQARAQGLDLAQYAVQVLSARVPPHKSAVLSPAERAQAWRESAQGLPHTAPLSDEAISREAIYGDHD